MPGSLHKGARCASGKCLQGWAKEPTRLHVSAVDSALRLRIPLPAESPSTASSDSLVSCCHAASEPCSKTLFHCADCEICPGSKATQCCRFTMTLEPPGQTGKPTLHLPAPNIHDMPLGDSPGTRGQFLLRLPCLPCFQPALHSSLHDAISIFCGFGGLAVCASDGATEACLAS